LENMSYLHLTWEDVDKLVWRIASRITGDGFHPDFIIAMGRGGFDPARILCDHLSVHRLGSVQMESYSGIAASSEPRVVIPLNADHQKAKALLVDDVSDSGRSLLKAREYLLSKNPAELRVVTLHVKPWTNYKPDYWIEETDKWVVYPWEIKEIIMELSKSIRKSNPNINLVDRLIKMGFDAKKVIRYLN
jgi:hypoxanthine phosphoribosyltransferase